MEIAGREGGTLAAEWADVAARLPRPHRARLPQHVPALRAEHERRHRLGDRHDRVRDGPRDRRPAARWTSSGAERIEVNRGAAESFDRELRRRLAGTVWHSGCTNWYVDENGNDPSQWPWLWSTYRRRTASLEPGAYALQ